MVCAAATIHAHPKTHHLGKKEIIRLRILGGVSRCNKQGIFVIFYHYTNYLTFNTKILLFLIFGAYSGCLARKIGEGDHSAAAHYRHLRHRQQMNREGSPMGQIRSISRLLFCVLISIALLAGGASATSEEDRRKIVTPCAWNLPKSSGARHTGHRERDRPYPHVDPRFGHQVA